MEKIKTIGKIGTALLLSFIIAQICSNVFFVNNNTSALRSHPEQYLAGYFKQATNSFIARITNTDKSKTGGPIQNTPEIAAVMEDRKQALQFAPLKQIAKGIQAQENESTSITTINTGEVESVVYTFDVDGKKVVVSIPKIYYDKFGLSEAKVRESIMNGE